MQKNKTIFLKNQSMEDQSHNNFVHIHYIYYYHETLENDQFIF